VPPGADAWDQATGHFCQVLPPGVSQWIIVAEAGTHDRICASLRERISVVDTVILGDAQPGHLLSLAERHAPDDAVGYLDFAFAGADVRFGGQYLAGLSRLGSWPANRCRLCVDVWDGAFAELFAEQPAVLHRRCADMAARLRDASRLAYTAPGSQLEFDCSGAEWVIYSGAEDYDYTLPTGEVACLPDAVDGRADIDGWIVGTIPFGVKYGHIQPGDLALSFLGGQIAAVHGNRPELCADIEAVLEAEPGLRSVGELGVGQSLAVRAARDLHPRGCLWHEKNFGLHIGLGAELAETGDIDGRVTGHHIDIVFAAGALSGEREPALLTW
jgi:hypothetical protein